jgi:PAS domain S-box-containing protein
MRRAAIWLKDVFQGLCCRLTGGRAAPEDERATLALVSMESLAQIINCVPDPIFVKDHQHRLVLVNDAECRLAGKSRQELLGRTDHDILPPEECEVFWRQDDRVIETGLESVSEDRIPDAQGIVRTMVTRKTRFTDGAGNHFVVGVIRDITRRKLEEQAVRSAKEYAENLIATANALIIGLDLEGRIQVFNREAERVTGYTSAELEGRDWFEVLTPRDRYPHALEAFRRMIADETSVEGEYPLLTKFGEERIVAWANTLVREGGEVVGTLSLGTDITERRQAA